MNPYISICIPTYEMNGLGIRYLTQCLDSLENQKFKDFEVIVSDNSVDDGIKSLISVYENRLNIRYFHRPKQGIFFSRNLNNALLNSNGEIVKVMFQDDFFINKDALGLIATEFKEHNAKWIVSACMHTKDGIKLFDKHSPRWNNKILFGKNSIGAPSVLAFRKSRYQPTFDPNLCWLMDCEFYYRLNQLYGMPTIIKLPCIASRIGPHQVTNYFTDKLLIEMEVRYIEAKFNIKRPFGKANVNILQWAKKIKNKFQPTLIN